MYNFIIVEDSRQKIGKHKLKLEYFNAQGIKTVRTKLYCGDFSRLDNQTVCIDTKQDVLEIAPSVCGKHHATFRDACIRAADNGIHLIILIEEPYSLATLSNWQSPKRMWGKFKGQPYTLVRGETLAKAMQSMTERYGVEFQFCDKKDSGRKIVEILSNLK